MHATDCNSMSFVLQMDRSLSTMDAPTMAPDHLGHSIVTHDHPSRPHFFNYSRPGHAKEMDLFFTLQKEENDYKEEPHLSNPHPSHVKEILGRSLLIFRNLPELKIRVHLI